MQRLFNDVNFQAAQVCIYLPALSCFLRCFGEQSHRYQLTCIQTPIIRHANWWKKILREQLIDRTETCAKGFLGDQGLPRRPLLKSNGNSQLQLAKTRLPRWKRDQDQDQLGCPSTGQLGDQATDPIMDQLARPERLPADFIFTLLVASTSSRGNMSDIDV